jgi:hypothetical protein
MASKQLQSRAIRGRIAKVGKTLTRTKAKGVFHNIHQWLKQNPSSWDKIWEFMESGLVWDLLGDANDMTMSDSCQQVSLLPCPTRMQFLRRNTPVGTFSKQALIHYKTIDTKYAEKLFLFKYQLPPKTPLKGGLRLAERKLFFLFLK